VLNDVFIAPTTDPHLPGAAYWDTAKAKLVFSAGYVGGSSS
jgi:hypothetical protein